MPAGGNRSDSHRRVETVSAMGRLLSGECGGWQWSRRVWWVLFRARMGAAGVGRRGVG